MRVTRAQRRRKSLRPSKSSASLTGAVGLGVAALAASQAGAATFNVTNLNDAGAGSLRQAVIDANTNAGADVITFQPGLTGTITLLTGQLSLYDSVDIQGPGPAVLSVTSITARRRPSLSSFASPVTSPGRALLRKLMLRLAVTAIALR